MFYRYGYSGRESGYSMVLTIVVIVSFILFVMELLKWFLVLGLLVLTIYLIKKLFWRRKRQAETNRFRTIQTSLGSLEFPTWRNFENEKETGYRQGGDAQHVACIKQILLNANGGEKLSRKLAELCIGQLGDLISNPLKTRLLRHLI